MPLRTTCIQSATYKLFFSGHTDLPQRDPSEQCFMFRTNVQEYHLFPLPAFLSSSYISLISISHFTFLPHIPSVHFLSTNYLPSYSSYPIISTKQALDFIISKCPPRDPLATWSPTTQRPQQVDLSL
ncbi:hypothetical protein ACN38_g12588 [Penicillium nordicum]|uniref:Uncharacterized protein n=1 Tax=Penicillium nordicum TaxID=229535 RepID=A0A0M9W9R1_9EURO|nr:hypothetical protein ACN38_g12588 [Penicillium nordicum]